MLGLMNQPNIDIEDGIIPPQLLRICLRLCVQILERDVIRENLSSSFANVMFPTLEIMNPDI